MHSLSGWLLVLTGLLPLPASQPAPPEGKKRVEVRIVSTSTPIPERKREMLLTVQTDGQLRGRTGFPVRDEALRKILNTTHTVSLFPDDEKSMSLAELGKVIDKMASMIQPDHQVTILIFLSGRSHLHPSEGKK